MPIIKTENLTYIYGIGTPFEKKALDNVSISVEKGEMIGIIGHTGSGKSTLVQHLNGLFKPTGGKVYVDGKDIWENKKSVREARYKVGLCFQYPEYQLFESTVYRDIAFGPKNMGLDDDEVDKRVRRAAEIVGLGEKRLERSPFDLSGGMKRRAAIAGVIALEPEVLILDEPTAGLDPAGRQTIIDMIENYRKDTGRTVIMISHSMDDVARFCDRVLVMNEGRVECFDTVKNVFADSKKLDSMGLGVPQVTQVLLKLKERGMNVRTDIFTVEEAKNELVRLLKGRGMQLD
ncbi:MAG: energy-coupling factor transporter ATPase [Clostridiales bacterium]|nr:energy-coupling factor transporter ATPase [Clostridia bacterium]MCR4564220.1 energy-coupling factor transporter ATPase [Clostridiales bacterium]